MLVLDASYLLAILLEELPEIKTIEAFKILDDHVIIAPSLLKLEITNTLLMKLNRKMVSKDFCINALKAFTKMDISYFQTDTIDDLDQILEFSHHNKLTIYDALYLKLAIKYNTKIASFDKKIIEIAQSYSIICV